MGYDESDNQYRDRMAVAEARARAAGRHASAEERIALALERIADSLDRFLATPPNQEREPA